MTALWLNLNHIRPRISFFYESSLFVYCAIQYWFESWACLTFEEVFVRNHPPFPWWTERARHRCAVHYRPKVLESRFSSVVKCIEKVFFWNYSLVYTTNFLLIFIIIDSKLVLEMMIKIFLNQKRLIRRSSYQIFPHRGKICRQFQNLWQVLYKQSPRNYPLTSQNRKIDVCTFNPRIFPLFLYSSLVLTVGL